MNLQKSYMMAKGKKLPSSLSKKSLSSGMGGKGNLTKAIKSIRKGEDGMETPDGEELPRIQPPSAKQFQEQRDEIKKLSSDLDKDASREGTREYQRMLNRKYNAGLAEDGIFGPKTQAAYDKFVASPKKKAAPTAANEQSFVKDMKSKMTPKTGQDEYEEMMAAKKAKAAKQAEDDRSILGIKPRTKTSDITYTTPKKPGGTGPISAPKRTGYIPPLEMKKSTGRISDANEAAKKRGTGYTPVFGGNNTKSMSAKYQDYLKSEQTLSQEERLEKAAARRKSMSGKKLSFNK